MFSVIIPLYNKEKWIEECISSVLSQSFEQFEVLVINDGSTDTSLEVIQHYLEDKRIRVITQPNAGVSKARNRGIEEAKYDLIAFLDADDLWHKDFLKYCDQAFTQFINTAIVGTKCVKQSNASHQSTQTPFNGEISIEEIKDYFSFAYKEPLFHSSSVVIKKNVFKKIGYFDNQLKSGEDLDMWFRIMIHYPGVFIKNELSVYRIVDVPDNKFKLPAFQNHLISYIIPNNEPYFGKVKDLEKFSYTFLLNQLFLYYFTAEYKVEAKRFYKSVPAKYRFSKARYALYCFPYTLAKWIFMTIFNRRNKF